MTRAKSISTFIFLTISLTLLPICGRAQHRVLVEQPDSTPLFNGVEVSVDLVGPIMKAVGDYGHLEGAVRVNLKDRYFPVLELGYGSCDYADETTNIRYKTGALYGKIGVDFNILKDKHDIYRLYLGARYAYTSYKADFSVPELTDPYWGGDATWGISDMKCNYHWAEAVVGTQVKIWGPLELGWSLRYRKRIHYKEGEYSRSWYVPGYGKSGKSSFVGTFNVIFAF